MSMFIFHPYTIDKNILKQVLPDVFSTKSKHNVANHKYMSDLPWQYTVAHVSLLLLLLLLLMLLLLFELIYISRTSTREPTSDSIAFDGEQGDLFYSAGPYENPGSRRGMRGYILTYSRLSRDNLNSSEFSKERALICESGVVNCRINMIQ